MAGEEQLAERAKVRKRRMSVKEQESHMQDRLQLVGPPAE